MRRFPHALLTIRDEAALSGGGVLTTVAGEAELAELRGAYQLLGRPLIDVAGPATLAGLCHAWVRGIRVTQLGARSWSIASSAAGVDRPELAARLRVRPPPARNDWIADWAPDERTRLAAWVCGLIVDRAPPDLATAPADPVRAVTVLAALVDPKPPALLVRVDSIDDCRAAARAATALIAAAPMIPTVIAASPGLLDRYLDEAPESAAKARLRQGALPRLPAPADPPPAAPPTPGRARPGTEVPAPASRPDRARSGGAPSIGPEEPERARSRAEARLFAALERDPRTSARFALNARIDVRFGGRRVEIDIASRDHHLAIEIDGYHHFVDPERYRTDRRKDLLLQLAGWVVLRVLADDVLDDTEAIVHTIATTLAALPKGATVRS